MWMLLPTALASGFGRQEETLQSTRYARVDGEGPAFGRWRNRRGAFEASHFADGQIEHVDTYDGTDLKETRLYAADGQLRAVVDWADAKVTLSLAPAVVVPIGAWSEVAIADLVFRAPPLVASETGWTGEHLAIAVQASADPFSSDFSTALRAGCGCEVESEQTVWVAGRAGAHYRLQRPTATADVVAIAVPDGLLVLTAAGPDLTALVSLRAMLATGRAP
ncbi:MAG: hypothetical protein R3F61_27480 [Myxococcota bacterium]